MGTDDLDEAALIAPRDPYDSAAPATRQAAGKLLEDASCGRRPGAPAATGLPKRHGTALQPE